VPSPYAPFHSSAGSASSGLFTAFLRMIETPSLVMSILAILALQIARPSRRGVSQLRGFLRSPVDIDKALIRWARVRRVENV
jgi:hypothetical protein